jgi:hypothetical protein
MTAAHNPPKQCRAGSSTSSALRCTMPRYPHHVISQGLPPALPVVFEPRVARAGAELTYSRQMQSCGRVWSLPQDALPALRRMSRWCGLRALRRLW